MSVPFNNVLRILVLFVLLLFVPSCSSGLEEEVLDCTLPDVRENLIGTYFGSFETTDGAYDNNSSVFSVSKKNTDCETIVFNFPLRGLSWEGKYNDGNARISYDFGVNNMSLCDFFLTPSNESGTYEYSGSVRFVQEGNTMTMIFNSLKETRRYNNGTVLCSRGLIGSFTKQ